MNQSRLNRVFCLSLSVCLLSSWNLYGQERAQKRESRALLDRIVSPSADTSENDEQGLQAFAGDVLNPEARGNSPNIKVALKAGIHRGAYTNDRFPDNRPFDVGNIFGEEDVYGSAAGFGWQFGIDVEIPRNTVFSWRVSGEYDHVSVGNSGVVSDPCLSRDGDTIGESAFHRFELNVDYLKLAGAAKLNFQRFYLLFGVTAATPVKNDVRFNRTFGEAPCFYNELGDMRNSRFPVPIPEISRLHFALRIGGGLTYQLSNSLQFSPELTLDFGFNAINKSPESDLGVYALNGVFRYDL